MKFNYTTSTGEEALYEAIPLTRELYENILKEDKNFLFNVSQNQNPLFLEKEFHSAALEMYQNYEKNNGGLEMESDQESLVLILKNKTILKESEKTKKKSQTVKSILRSHLSSNKIRKFKKNKMSIVLG